MTKPASWSITVTICYRNGISQQATVSDDCCTTLRELSATLERARTLAEAMRPMEQQGAAPGWQPRLVNE
jgi:hypothetical protein